MHWSDEKRKKKAQFMDKRGKRRKKGEKVDTKS